MTASEAAARFLVSGLFGNPGVTFVPGVELRLLPMTIALPGNQLRSRAIPVGLCTLFGAILLLALPTLQEKDTYLEGTRNLGSGDLQSAEWNLRHTLAVRNPSWQKRTSAEDWVLADASNSLGVVLVREGRCAEAEATFGDALNVARTITVGNDGLSAAIIANLSDLYKQAGKVALAESLLKESLSLESQSTSDKKTVYARI